MLENDNGKSHPTQPRRKKPPHPKRKAAVVPPSPSNTLNEVVRRNVVATHTRMKKITEKKRIRKEKKDVGGRMAEGKINIEGIIEYADETK